VNEGADAFRGQGAGNEPDADPGDRADGCGDHHGGAKQAAAGLGPERAPAQGGEGLQKHGHGYEANGQTVADQHVEHGIQGNGHAVAQKRDVQDGEGHGLLS